MFAMEVVSVGVMYYSALVPCAFSAIIGAWLAKLCGVGKEGFIIGACEYDQITITYRQFGSGAAIRNKYCSAAAAACYTAKSESAMNQF